MQIPYGRETRLLSSAAGMQAADGVSHHRCEFATRGSILLNFKRHTYPTSRLVLSKVVRGPINSPLLSVLTCGAYADRATAPMSASLSTSLGPMARTRAEPSNSGLGRKGC